MSKITLMLDCVAYKSKPCGEQISAITGRLKRHRPTEVEPDVFAQAVANGCTFVGGCFEKCAGKPFGKSEFLGQQLFPIDIDNDTEDLGEDGAPAKDERGRKRKRSLMPNEKGYLDPWDAIERFKTIFDCMPLLVYPSFSYRFGGTVADRTNPETRMKYRLVLDAGKLVFDAGKAEAIRRKLLKAFPEADPACVNANRLYFGSCGKAALFSGEGASYYVRRAG